MTRVILLAVALAIAVVTAVLVRNFLARQDGDAMSAGEATVPIAVPKVEVLVAAGDLPAGTRLEAASVRWQGWPEDGVNPDYVTRGAEGTPESFDGFVVRRGLLAGEPMLASKLIRPDAGDLLSAVLAPGMRGFTLEVSAEQSGAGFVQPGSQVDVILTQEVRSQNADAGGASTVVSETILRDVRVAAIDQTLGDTGGEAKLSSTITLEVTPKQAERLAVARQLGEVTLSLRSIGRDAGLEAGTGAFTRQDEVSSFLGGRALVARRDLRAGTLLRDTDTAFLEVTAAMGDADGLIAGSAARVAAMNGAFLRADRKAGEPLRQTDLILPGEKGFIVAALTPGMRAISVAVTQVSGVSGYIAPGDRVDIVMTHQIDDTSETPALTPRKYGETIVGDVRLLAIEQSVDPATGKPLIGQSATLEVTQRQAETLALGARMGELTLLLRAGPDAQPAEQPLPGVYTSDLAISRATVDFLLFGTRNAPELSGGGTDAAGAPVERATVRLYRSTAPSILQVQR